MMFLIIIGIVLIIWIYVSRPKRICIPGPWGIPFYGVWNQLPSMKKTHVHMAKWQQKYGPVMYIPLMSFSGVFVSGYDAIYEVTVKKGKEFGGRAHSTRGDLLSQKTGILTSREMDDKWRLLRKTSQRHLKQFGDGMSKLEKIIETVGEDMFKCFKEKTDKAFDPHQVIFDTALNNIIFLITGERTRFGDPLVEKMGRYEEEFLRVSLRTNALTNILIECVPFSKYLGLKGWNVIQKFVEFEQDIWDGIKRINAANPTTDSLSKLLMATAESGPHNDKGKISEIDARKTSMNLLIAGVTTTSNTFYGSVNILAHYPDIQYKLASEIFSVCPFGEPVSLSDRPRMPYCRAFLWELLRYTSVVPLSVPHRATSDQTIQGYFIPKDTKIQVNIYAFHHDPDFWTDPNVFRPERFLDEDGDLVPADHPNRKHVMPFGAGPRVCLGETLALTRLFLWITTLVSRFAIEPAEGNTPNTLDTKEFYYIGILRPKRYEVILKKRLGDCQ